MPKKPRSPGATPLRPVAETSPLREHYFELLSDPLAFLVDVSSMLSAMDPRTYGAPGDDGPPVDLDAYLEMVIDDLGIETTALLSVVAQLTPPRYADRAAAAAARRQDPVLPWVSGLADAQVVDASRMQDVFGDAVDYVFEVRSPGIPVFCQLVHVDRRNGSAVVDAFFVDMTLDALRRRSREEPEMEQVVWLGVDLAGARGVIEAGIELSAMLLPQPETDSWPMARAMTEWVLRMLPPAIEPDPPAADDATRARLLVQFAGCEAYLRLHPRVQRDASAIAEMLIEFAVNYGTGDPLEWSPMGVGQFFSWWTGKVAAAGLEDALPAVVEAWVAFALERRGLARRFIEAALRDVHQLCEQFEVGGYGQDATYNGLDFSDIGIEILPFGSLGAWGRPDLDVEDLPDVIGSERAVQELTEDPLPDEEFDWSGVPDAIHDEVARVLQHIDRGAELYEDERTEVRTAQRRLLARAAREAPGWFAPKAKSTGSASAICWLIGKANDLLNPYGPVTAAGLAEAVGASGSASQRAHRLQKMLGMPGGDHRVFLADGALLVSEYRSQLIELRDAP